MRQERERTLTGRSPMLIHSVFCDSHTSPLSSPAIFCLAPFIDSTGPFLPPTLELLLHTSPC